MEFKLNLKRKLPLAVGDLIERTEYYGGDMNDPYIVVYKVVELKHVESSDGPDIRVFGSSVDWGWDRRYLFRMSRYDSLVREGKLKKIE